jgi:hypothetical protein
LAAAVAEVACQRVVRAGHQIGAQDISCFHAALDRSEGWRRIIGTSSGGPCGGRLARPG